MPRLRESASTDQRRIQARPPSARAALAPITRSPESATSAGSPATTAASVSASENANASFDSLLSQSFTAASRRLSSRSRIATSEDPTTTDSSSKPEA